MKSLLRLGRQRPYNVRKATPACSRMFSSNVSSTAPRWSGLKIAATAAAAAAVGFGVFYSRTGYADAQMPLLSEKRLPSVKYATLAQMEKVMTFLTANLLESRIEFV